VQRGASMPMNIATSASSAAPDEVQGSSEETIARLVNVEKTFYVGGQPVHALRNINLEIKKGTFNILMGRSGSGKTTLLNILGGLDRPTKGEVYFRGQNISTLSDRSLTQWRRREVNFIFQSFALLPTLTAYENTELPLRIIGVRGRERRRRTRECLEIVGLWKRAFHRTFELSGGEQQRVGIARALTTKPNLLLADEPTGELDTRTGLKILTLFKDIVGLEGITICMVTHDPKAADFGDNIYHMDDGRIITT
jgi:putative ABC transport system ATP-binding protein